MDDYVLDDEVCLAAAAASVVVNVLSSACSEFNLVLNQEQDAAR